MGLLNYETIEEVSDSESDEMESLGNELSLISESISESARAIRVLEAIREDYKQGLVTDQQVKYVTFAMESAFSDDPEGLKEVLACENILTRIGLAIVRFLSNIKEGIKKQVDYLEYSYTFFNLQRGRVRKLRDLLRASSGKEAEVSVGVNKYLLAGDPKKEVQSMDEYSKLFSKFSGTMTPFMRSIAELLEDDLFSSLKFYKEYITGDPEDFFRERFMSLDRTLTKASTGLLDKKTISKATYVEYDSGVMLGLSRAVVRLPQKNTYKNNDYESLLHAHKFFYMYVDRKTKFNLGTLVSGSVRLTVTKAQIEKILHDTEQVLDAVDTLFKFSSQLSHAGAAMSVNYSDLFLKRDPSETYDPNAIVRGMQIFSRVCSILFDSTSSGYVYSLTNIKQALSIAEKAVKRF